METMTTLTTAPLIEHVQKEGVPEEDQGSRPTRRHFSAAYKPSILEEYSALTEPGAKGALLRREGLYSSHLVERRRSRDLGALVDSPSKTRSSNNRELDVAKRRIVKLEDQLQRHQQALEA